MCRCSRATHWAESITWPSRSSRRCCAPGNSIRGDLPQGGATAPPGRIAPTGRTEAARARVGGSPAALGGERLREEIRIARQIQQKLFPVAPLPLPGFDIRGSSYPAEATGGDYFDYIPQRDGSLGVVIGDVCGHGFGPALLMAELRAYLQAFVMTHTDVSEIVTLLNTALSTEELEDRFATLLLAQLEPRTGSFTYVSAGHHPGYILDSNGRVKTTLPSTDLPLGIHPATQFTAAPALTLGPGEGVLLITDGIVEAHPQGGNLFGTAATLDLVREHWGRTPAISSIRSTAPCAPFCGEQTRSTT